MPAANSPIEAALNSLEMKMPRQILELAFFPSEEHRTTDATSLKERIRSTVIDNFVMTAMNTHGGKAIRLDIQQSWINVISPTLVMVNVPKNVTQNRRITSTLNASFGTNMVSSAAVGIANQGSQYLMGASRMFNSAKTPPYVGTPDIEVMGNNQLEIRNFVALPIRLSGIVRIEYSRDFTELRNQYWSEFEYLVELAIKAYCYNNLIVLMDRAELQGGMELGRLSSKIEEWSDVYETYSDVLRERWRRILILNDPLLSSRGIKKLVNP